VIASLLRNENPNPGKDRAVALPLETGRNPAQRRGTAEKSAAEFVNSSRKEASREAEMPRRKTPKPEAKWVAV